MAEEQRCKTFMNKQINQKGDLGLYYKLLALHRRKLCPFFVFKHLQHLFVKNHTTYDDKDYFDRIAKFVSITPHHSFEFYKNELIANELLKRNYLKALSEGKIRHKFKTYEARCGNTAHIVNFYALIRILKPKTVVETGTANGSMTSWMLAAIEKNGIGKLISIDIPAIDGKFTMGMSVEKGDAGLLIPREYHHRWHYIAGDAKLFLPKVLSENDVDLFVHDSLHTRTHMLFEYNVARALMRPETLILSDDILWNNAWFEFISSHKLNSIGCISNPNLGLTLNTFDDFEKEIGVGIIRG